MIEADIIEDSISDAGIRLTTFQVKFHRFVLPEHNTHRAFSRNFSSSRAIPTAKLIEQVRTDAAKPVHWGANEPGMQAKGELKQLQKVRVESLWQEAALTAADIAEKMAAEGAHKQIVNRLIEPYLYVNGVVTSTEWANFFELRAHPDAQPEIQALAYAMLSAFEDSEPKVLKMGEWHLPYVKQDERSHPFLALPENKLLLSKISAARCCRVSYLKNDGTKANISEDLALCERLVGARPLHSSPFEHQATPDEMSPVKGVAKWNNKELHGNFVGWCQFRKYIEQSM